MAYRCGGGDSSLNPGSDLWCVQTIDWSSGARDMGISEYKREDRGHLKAPQTNLALGHHITSIKHLLEAPVKTLRLHNSPPAEASNRHWES